MKNDHREPSEKSDAKQLVYALYGAFGERNVAALGSILSEDWQDVPMSPGQVAGPVGFADLINGFHDVFSDVSVTVERMLVEGDRVAAKVMISGVQIGPFLGVAPTNERANIAAHDFHLIRNGRIVRTDHLEDFFGFLQRAGALPG